MENRICQICQESKTLDNFYTIKSYICKECHSFVTNVSRFKKVIKTKGINFATDMLIKDELMCGAKRLVLSGITINESCRKTKGGS